MTPYASNFLRMNLITALMVMTRQRVAHTKSTVAFSVFSKTNENKEAKSQPTKCPFCFLIINKLTQKMLKLKITPEPRK